MTLPYLFLPHGLSDEAAACVPQLLNDLAVAFDDQYFAQIRRYKASLRHASGTYYDELNQRPDFGCACHDGQLDLFEGDDVAF